MNKYKFKLKSLPFFIAAIFSFQLQATESSNDFTETQIEQSSISPPKYSRHGLEAGILKALIKFKCLVEGG